MSSIPAVATSVGVFGHRDEKFSMQASSWAQGELRRVLRDLKDRNCTEIAVTAMARGTDLWAASKAIGLGMLHVPMLPFADEPVRERWPAAHKRLYERVLADSQSPVVIGELPVADEDLSPAQKRQQTSERMLALFHQTHEAIVDAVDVVVAVWSGTPNGGTAHALACAALAGKPTIVIHLRERRTFVAKPESLARVLDITLPLQAESAAA